jgi:hypothetical protein
MEQHKRNWVRRFEHVVLRVVSLIFSLVSAHAILWFFGALDPVDHLQPFVKWGIALGFGVLGYFVSRGLAHRLLNKERIRVYAFICGVFELVEVVCNFAMAAVAVKWIDWLGLLPPLLHQVLLVLTYLVLSIIPVVTIMLAWVDMDLERAKQGYVVPGFGSPAAAHSPFVPMGAARPAAGPQPKAATATGVSSLNGAAIPTAPTASYAQGYQAPAPAPAAVAGQGQGGWWQQMQQGAAGLRDRLPFGHPQGPAPAQPVMPPVAQVAPGASAGNGPFGGLMNNTSRMG